MITGTITHWKARRSGPAITVTGRDEQGDERKIDVESIEAGTVENPRPVAVDPAGRRYELA